MVEVSDYSDFSKLSIADSLQDTTRFYNGINHDGNIYWRVKAKNQFGWGPFSDVWRFNRSEFSGYIENEDNISIVSPNPASDFINVSVEVGSEPALTNDVRIYNIFGQIVSTPNPTPTLPASREGVRIDVTNLAPGMYFVRIGDKLSKFVKL
jgi:hypothetical protein